MGKIDIAAVPERLGSTYPPPFATRAGARIKQALGNAAELSDFGVNLTRLPPGAWSSQRHWHSNEDEFVYVLSGEVILITDAGEQTLGAGDCAGFPKGSADGHHLINRSDGTAIYLEVGSRSADDVCTYPDIDLHLERASGFTHKDGTPYAI
ncbi:MAG: cupin domain-containing protein [Rhodanobacteraceae bacterium]